MSNGRYPAAYRPGAAKYQTGGRSNDLSNLLEQAIRQTEDRRALQRALSQELRSGNQRARGVIPKSGAARRVGGFVVKRTLLGKALNLATGFVPQTVQTVPGLIKAGDCPIVDPLDYSDIRDGLPSVTCQTGQAVGPGYSFHCNLGAGIWVKRANAFNYNQLSWWFAGPDCAAVRAKGGPWTVSGWKYLGNLIGGSGGRAGQDDPNKSADAAGAAQGVNTGKVPEDDWSNAAETRPYAEWVKSTDLSAPPLERSEIGPTPQTQTDPVMLEVAKTERPGRATRETKVTVPRWLLRAVGLVTEGLDLVGAVYDALPDKLKKREAAKRGGKNPSLPDKAMLIYANWESVDVRRALFNIAYENLIEDRAYAYVSKHTKSPYPLPGSVSGGRSLQTSQQGDADLPHGRLPTGELKKLLQEALGL